MIVTDRANRRRDRPRSDVAVVLVARIGDLDHGARLPAGTISAVCDRCHAPVWVTATALEIVREAGCRPVLLCSRCLPPDAA
jgi:hypothetical protein